MHYQLCIINKSEKFKSWKDTQFYRKIDWHKRQYLLFEDGTVFNIRSSEGYVSKFLSKSSSVNLISLGL
jgi:hypothetical protein